MDTCILAQVLTVNQVGSRAVGAEGGDRVRDVVKASFESPGADVSDRNAGAIFTLELIVRVACGGDRAGE